MGNIIRRDGSTTRLANMYIQNLFRDGEIVVQDHYPTPKADVRLFEIIHTRLRLEHTHLFQTRHILANRGERSIKLLEEPYQIKDEGFVKFTGKC